MQNRTLSQTHRSNLLVPSLEHLNDQSVEDNPLVCPSLISIVLAERGNGGVVGPPILHLSLLIRTILRDSTGSWTSSERVVFRQRDWERRDPLELDAVRGDPELLQQFEGDVTILSKFLVHCDELAVDARRNFNYQRGQFSFDVNRSFAVEGINTNKRAG
jgi:hypothetical protein